MGFHSAAACLVKSTIDERVAWPALVAGSQGSFVAHERDWSAIVGSRLSRSDEDFGKWPIWIERAVRFLHRDQRTR